MKKVLSHIIFIGILLGTSIGYAVSTKEITQTGDMMWAIIVNGVISIIGFGGWTWGGSQFIRYHRNNLEEQKKINKELIETKNKHAETLARIEQRLKDCKNCP